ncbi:MAG: phasin family protein [Gammaproteobacteria bacterium]|nr:phasin family protein [Gammaproteobacteria bacterium]
MPKETESNISKDLSRASEEAAMPRKAHKTAQKEDLPFPVPFAEMEDFNASAFDAYMRTSRAILENTAALNQEMLRFAGERFQADLAALQTLPGYTNVQGVMTFQSEFMRKAAEAYQAEFSKLMQQSTEAASTMFEPLIESVKKSAKEGARK